MSERDTRSDEALLAAMSAGDEGALRALYARHAGLVFSIAARVVSRDAAEDVVQEVFLLIWRKHEQFDPSRGTLKSWLARIAKNRALNEQRRSASRDQPPVGEPDEQADPAALPDEAPWLEHRRDVLRAALAALPSAQRRAVTLAYFDELAHTEVATVLGAPLGTIKTRIRRGLQRLSVLVGAALVAVVALVLWRAQLRISDRDQRALRMVTASDVVPLRLVATAEVPTSAHGSYRSRLGSPLAVVTTSNLPAPPQGERYVAWARKGTTWLRSTSVELGEEGRSVSIFESELLVTQPDEVEVTRETSLGSAPLGPVVLHWSR